MSYSRFLLSTSLLGILIGCSVLHGQSAATSSNVSDAVQLSDRFDIPVKLKKDIKVASVKESDTISVLVTENVKGPHGNGLLRKDSEVTCRVSHVENRAEAFNKGQKERPLERIYFSLLCEQALENEGTLKLNAFAVSPITWTPGGTGHTETFSSGVSFCVDPVHHTTYMCGQSYGRIRTDASSSLSVLHDTQYGSKFTPTVIPADTLVVPAGSTFLIRHLSREYDLGLLFSQEQYDVSQTLKTRASQGDATAQFALGLLYQQGKGFVQNSTRAAEWYAKAADQGSTDAQTNLAVLYAQGQGVPQDYVAAYMWFLVSTQAGVEHNRDALTMLERRMSSEQITEAKRRAQAWMQTHGSANPGAPK